MPPRRSRAASAALGLASLLLLFAAVWAQGGDQGPLAPPVELGQDPFASSAAGAELPPADAAAAPARSGFGLAPGVGAPAGEPRLRMAGVATVAYGEEPISPYGAAPLGCGLGFVAPTFQVGLPPACQRRALDRPQPLRLRATSASVLTRHRSKATWA